MPTLPAPAPAFALALKRFASSSPRVSVPAFTAMPFAVTCASPIQARVWVSMLLTAAAAPMPTVAVLPAVLPSASASASVLLQASTASRPPACSSTPLAT